MSLRFLLGFVAAFSAALALTQIDFAVSCWILTGIIVALNFVLSAHTWRVLVYGGLAGIFVMCVVMQIVIAETVGNNSTANYQSSGTTNDIMVAWRSYVVHLGAFFGASVNWAVWRRWKPPHESG